MFCTPLIDCSNGIRTESTNTLALAPGYAMATSTVGGVIEGNCDIGRVSIPNSPRNKTMIEMTMANAGRRRICENMVLVGFGIPYRGSDCYSAWYFSCATTSSGRRSSHSTLRAVANLLDPLENLAMAPQSLKKTSPHPLIPEVSC